VLGCWGGAVVRRCGGAAVRRCGWGCVAMRGGGEAARTDKSQAGGCSARTFKLKSIVRGETMRAGPSIQKRENQP
jgi:hypothetical protein